MPRTATVVLAAALAGAASAAIFSGAASVPASAASGVADPQPKIATVDMLHLLERMLDTEPYESAREAATQVWNDQIQPLADESQSIVATLQQNPEDAGAQSLYEQYQALQQRINRLSQDAREAIDRTSAEQLADAYRKIHAAVQAVAEEQGIEQVFSSRMHVDALNAQNTNVIVQEVLLRPVLRNQGGEDLTETLRERLGLPEAAPEEPAQPGVEGPDPLEGGG